MRNFEKRKNRKKQPVTGTAQSPGGTIFFGFLVVLLPLVFYKNAMDPALMPQLLAAGIFLLGFFIFSFFSGNRFQEKRIYTDLMLGIALLYFFVGIVASFSAVNVKESYFDTSRTFIFLMVMFFSVHQLERTPGWISRLPDLFLIATTIMLLIGIYQYVDFVVLAEERFLPDGRSVLYNVRGLMAHKNLYASALFLSLPFLMFGGLSAQKKKRIAFVLVFSLSLGMLVLLSTRAVWLGTLVAAFIITGAMIIMGKQFNLSGKFRLLLLIAVVLVFLGGLGYMARPSQTGGFSPVERFKSIFDPQASNNRYRLNVWEVSLEIWDEKPVLGVGPGNWKIEAPPYFHQYNFTKQQLNWNRPHNDFIWVLTEKGGIGLTLYIALFITAFFYLFRIIRRSSQRQHKILALLLGGTLGGYLTISFFSFPMERIYHQVILALILAISIFMHAQMGQKAHGRAFPPFLRISLLAGLLFVVVYAFSATKVEETVKKTAMEQERGNWRGMLRQANAIPTTFRNLDAEAMPVYYYHGFAHEKLKNYRQAKDYYLEALEDNPAKVQVMNNLGLVYFFLDDHANAKKCFEHALSVLPVYFEALVNLAAVYGKEGNYTKCLESLDRIPESARDERYFAIEKQVNKLIREGK